MKIIDLFSEEVIKLWNGWEVRALILLSLLLQIILIIFGSQRKYRTGIWIKSLVWTTYMAADWVATVALGNLAKIQADSGNYCSKSPNIALQTFWAPLLLLHLGGPDTITAYSLEDNELWSRHLLGLIVEVGVAFYIFFRSLSNTALTFVSIPVFISGIIKYGERTYVLRSASNKQFKEALTLLSSHSVREHAMRIVMGISEDDFFEIELMEEQKKISIQQQLGRKKFSNLIEAAHFLFMRFEYLFANLILGFNERIDCFNIISEKSYQDAFKLVAIELGFIYDVIYTKATLYRTQLGLFFRTISFFSSVSALVAFSIVIDGDAYHQTDISITFLLLGGAVFLEVYAFIILLFSDWTNLWLVKLQQPKIKDFHESLLSSKRWSASIGQYNLISFCLEDVQGMFTGVQKLPYIGKLFEEYQLLTREDVNADMQEMIFEQLQEKGSKIRDNYTIKSCKELLAHRGDRVLNKWNKLDEFSWSTIDVEFDHSLLVWHIATDMCYYVDSDKYKDAKKHKISKCLSDYMLYLLVQCPSMLPKGIGEIRYRDTCVQVIQLFKNDKDETSNQEKACKMLLGKTSKRPITQSILSDGCELARKLQSLEHRGGSEDWNFEKKWTMISEVWIEMLAYAASHCGWKEHAQQLWKGGELLTHVCLLMAHLGLSEQYNEKEQFYLL